MGCEATGCEATGRDDMTGIFEMPVIFIVRFSAYSSCFKRRRISSDSVLPFPPNWKY